MTNLVEFPAGGALRLRVAEEVRALMGRRRMSQAQLGAVLKISQVSVSERLRGKTPFTLDDLERLASHFDVSLSSLLGETTTERPTPPAVTSPYPFVLADAA